MISGCPSIFHKPSLVFGYKAPKIAIFIWVVLALISLVIIKSNAAEVTDLFRVQVSVQDQSAAMRNQALAKGLLKVVDRVAGSPTWRNQLGEQQLISNTQQLLEQYGYIRSRLGTELLLDMRFSGAALKDLLSGYGVPVWGSARPRVLFWIAIEANNRRQVLSQNTAPALADTLKRAMSYWGIPGLLPLMDLEDTSALNVSDLWGFFTDPVESASRRYSSETIVLARVVKDSAGRWQVLWQLRQGGRNIEQGQLEESSSQRWANSLVAGVAASLASIYAVRMNSESGTNLLLEVKGIRTFRDYVDVSRVLEGLAPVKNVLPVVVVGEVVRFELTLSGNQDQLAEHLALYQSMVPTLAEDLSEAGAQLVYLWQP